NGQQETAEGESGSFENPLDQWLSKAFFKMAASLVVKGASVQYKDSADQLLYSLDPFDLEISIDDLSQPEKLIDLLLKGRVNANVSPSLPLNLPIELQAKPLQFGGSVVRASGVSLKLGGFASTIEGMTDLGAGSHNWKVSLMVKSLLDLPIPPDMLPPGKWFGGLQGQAQVYQEPGKPMLLVSDFKTLNFGGDVALQSPAYKVQGRLLSEVSWNVRYQDSTLSAKDIKVSVNADSLEIQAPPYFRKSAKDKFAIDVEGFVANDTFVLKSKRVELNQLKFNLNSSIGIKNKMLANIKLNLIPTSLKGLERLFPLMAKQPMEGNIQFRSEVVGPLKSGASGLRVSVNPIVLQKFKSQFELKDDKNKIYANGPMTADLKGAVRIKNNQVDYGNVKGSVDLTGMSLDYKGQFKKSVGQKLSAKLDVGHRSDSLVTSGSSLQYGPSSLTVKGSLKDFNTPTFDLNLKLSNFQTSLVSRSGVWPKDLVANGAIAGNFDMRGTFDSLRGISKSPIKVKGVANTNFSRVEYRSESAKVNPEVAQAPAPKPLKTVPSFLPPWPLFKDLNLTVNSRIAKFRYNQVSAEGLAAKAVIAKGGASISSKVAKVFKGQAELKKLLVPLIWENPVLRMSGSVKGLDVPLAFKSLELDGLPKMTGL
ncbi:MAG: hypothetical protein AAF202_06990, partial [Pseudomonadota bacterium]